ncbi:MAG: 3-deoxy-manno-octulosonate cytidylyltransferase [Planctomycetota bacterium]
MNPVIIIPARYESSRFPGKPLAHLLGKPLVAWVWERCVAALGPDRVYVATDDERIERECLRRGIRVVMTSEDCATGTDRVYEASQKIGADYYINVQGDEPLVQPEDVHKVIAFAEKNRGSVVNAMCKIASEEEFRDPKVPKVVADRTGRLMYISRAAIPTTKGLAFRSAWKQVCIYGFSPEALAQFGEHREKSPVEEIEDIEILRFLELGFDVRMTPVSPVEVAVDFPEDIAVAERALRRAA